MLPLPFLTQEEPPEWLIVQRVIEEAATGNPAAWEMLAQCARIEAYTDGSAPIVNPGGPAGFAAVVVGWNKVAATTPAPTPDAQLNLAGFIPARSNDPPTSNNRAEVAGIMAALDLVRSLPSSSEHVSIWSDSDYALNCALGRYKRKKNLDLWACFDTLHQRAQTCASGGISMDWLKGHAGNVWNQAADDLATRAAFNFDDSTYQRHRAAQRATGREMPNLPGTLPGNDPSSQTIIAAIQDPSTWKHDAHYTLVLTSHIAGDGRQSVGRGPASGRYQLWTKNGKGARSNVDHAGERTADEAEYLTLIAALDDLLARITDGHKDPAAYSLTLYSRRELVIKQLQGDYRVRAASLQPLQAQARAQLDRFATVELIWKQGPAIEQLLQV
jgi:ribonuclease HI